MAYETCKNCGDYLYEGKACCYRKDAVLQRERAIKAEAELAESNRILAIHKRDYESHFKVHQEELAKREKALEEVNKVAPLKISYTGHFLIFQFRDDDFFMAETENCPELAEWLKQRNK